MTYSLPHSPSSYIHQTAMSPAPAATMRRPVIRMQRMSFLSMTRFLRELRMRRSCRRNGTCSMSRGGVLSSICNAKEGRKEDAPPLYLSILSIRDDD